MVKIAIIGAGISGVSLSLLLSKKFKIKIFEKSRGVGGRMSSRKIDPYLFDHGAQYFKIKNLEFKKFLSPLFKKKIIRPWLCRFINVNEHNKIKKELWDFKKNHFVGVPYMDSIVKYLAKDCNINLNIKIDKIKKIKNKWNLFDDNNSIHKQFDWVILTLPAEQTCSLISKNISFYHQINLIKMMGCYSLMLGMEQPLKLDYDAALIENQDIRWVAINNSKPERKNGYSILINSSFDYAQKNISTPKEKVIKHLLNLTQDLIKKDLTNAKLKQLHQWRYVQNIQYPEEDFFIDKTQKIAVCGDWFVNNRVEGAFESAKRLSNMILKLT